jgi:hypothetical protein
LKTSPATRVGSTAADDAPIRPRQKYGYIFTKIRKPLGVSVVLATETPNGSSK